MIIFNAALLTFGWKQMFSASRGSCEQRHCGSQAALILGCFYPGCGCLPCMWIFKMPLARASACFTQYVACLQARIQASRVVDILAYVSAVAQAIWVHLMRRCLCE